MRNFLWKIKKRRRKTNPDNILLRVSDFHLRLPFVIGMIITGKPSIAMKRRSVNKNYFCSITIILLLLAGNFPVSTQQIEASRVLRQRRIVIQVDALVSKHDDVRTSMYDELDRPKRKRRAKISASEPVEKLKSTTPSERRMTEPMNVDSGWTLDRYLEDLMVFDMSLSLSLSMSLSFSLSMSMP
jgi:hypothetical protein